MTKMGELLIQAARNARDMTPEEIREQRISFAYGMLPEESPLTKGQVAEIVDRQYGYPTKEGSDGIGQN